MLLAQPERLSPGLTMEPDYHRPTRNHPSLVRLEISAEQLTICACLPMWYSMETTLTLGSPVRVLLVEDDPEIAKLTRAQVSEDADTLYHFEWKDNVVSAISRLAKPGIDVVLLDLGMPELSGYRTHLAINTVAPKIPVVIFTSDESAVSRDITRAEGAFAYLVKREASPIELRQALHEAALSASVTGNGSAGTST